MTKRPNLANAFAALRDDPEPDDPPLPPVARSATRPTPVPQRVSAKLTKSTHPDWEGIKVFVRKDTRKLAWRKWEDQERGDFSDLVQHLLEKFLGT